jgi:type II secretory pathway pseudopilin PulG
MSTRRLSRWGRQVTGWLPTPAALVRRNRPADDAGMTLVELMIASTLLIVLLTAVMITMNMLNTVSSSVTAQYQEFDQALPALAPMQNLLRAEVEPGPNVGVVPQPGFASVGNFSLTFYSDIGTAYNNVTSTGVGGGPAKIVAQELDANGNPVTTATTCSTSSQCSFQVKQYLPVITAGVSNCPIAGQGGTACVYSGAYKLIVNVSGVVNNPALAPTSAPTQPIFTYNVLDPNLGVGANLATSTVQAGLTCVAPTGSQTIAQSCPQDFIQSVGVELMVAKKGSGINGSVDEQTIVYRYAKSSGATNYPYQYSGS